MSATHDVPTERSAIGFILVAALVGVGIGFMQPVLELAILVLLLPVALFVGFKRPEVVLVTFVYAGAFKSVVPLPVDLTVLLGVTVIILSIVTVGRDGLPHVPWGAWAFLGVVFLVVAGLAVGGLSEYGIEKASRFAILGLTAFLGALILVSSEERLTRAANIAIILGLLMSAYAVLGGGTEEFLGRFTAFGSNTIALGRAAAVALVGSVIHILWTKRAFLWAVPSILVCLWALGGSGSRGPAAAALLAIGLLIAYRLGRRGARRGLVILTAIGAVVVAALAWQTLPAASVARVAGVFSGVPGASILSRLQLYSVAWEATVENPITGIGTGAFASRTTTFLYPHNIMLELASENGLLVLALMTASLGNAVVRAWRGMVRRPGFASDFLTMALVMAFVNALVSGDLNDNRFLFAMMGIAFAITWAVPPVKESGAESDLTDRVHR